MEKLKIPKLGMKKDKLILCFLAGLLLLVAAVPTKPQNTEEVKESLDAAVISDNASLLEKQLEQVLGQIAGLGQVQAAVTLEPFIDDRDAPEIRGVVVVAQSGDDPVQILKIQETVMTLFQIDAHKIKVMKMK